MRISVYKNAGECSISLDIEYDSKTYSDIKEADEYISRILPGIALAPEDDEEQRGEEAIKE